MGEKTTVSHRIDGLICPVCGTWYSDSPLLGREAWKIGDVCGDTSLKQPDQPPCNGRLERNRRRDERQKGRG